MLKLGCLALILIGLGMALPPRHLHAQTSALSVEEVAKIKAQEFSRSLVQLKVQEVALQRATPLDERALGTNRAQQAVLEQELVQLTTAPMRAELQSLEAVQQSLAVDFRPKHPKMLALQAKIDQVKTLIAANH